MSGTFMAPIHPLSLPSAHHKHYVAKRDPHSSSTPLLGATATAHPTSLAHDLLAKHSASKWFQKQRHEYKANREIRQAKREALKAEQAVDVNVSSRRSSEATLDGKMAAVFAGL
jgi:hypothetical protein